MKKDRNNKKIYIELDSDYQLNLLHGILVEEERKANRNLEILSSKGDNKFANTKKAFKEVKRLRRLLTVMDDSSDYFGAFKRIEEYELDEIEDSGEKW